MTEPREGKPSGSRPKPRDVGRPQDDPPPRVCDLCGGAALERHCKVICLNCGYQRDCSDP